MSARAREEPVDHVAEIGLRAAIGDRALGDELVGIERFAAEVDAVAQAFSSLPRMDTDFSVRAGVGALGETARA